MVAIWCSGVGAHIARFANQEETPRVSFHSICFSKLSEIRYINEELISKTSYIHFGDIEITATNSAKKQ